MRALAETAAKEESLMGDIVTKRMATAKGSAEAIDLAIERAKDFPSYYDDLGSLFGLVGRQVVTHPSNVAQETVHAPRLLREVEDDVPMQKFLTWWRRNLASGTVAAFQGGMLKNILRMSDDPAWKNFWGKTVPGLFEVYEGRVSARLFQASLVQQDVANAVTRYATKHNQDVTQVGEMLTRHRTARTLGQIPDVPLRKAAQRGQRVIDQLTEEMLELGLDPKLADTMKENLGKYMHLSYAVHNKKGWGKMVRGHAAWDNAFRFLVEKYGIAVPPGVISP